MPIAIKMPALSPTMEEGTLAKWLVKVGDKVASGDIMAEIETDKATMEFEAVDEGTITAIEVAEGSEGVKVGTVIAMIAGEDEDASATPPAEKLSPVQGKGSGEGDSKPASAPQAAPTPSPSSASDGKTRTIASPLAKRLAADKGVDLASVQGSGPNGRIVKADVEGAKAGAPAAKAEAQPAAAPVQAPAAKPAAAAPATTASASAKLTDSIPDFGIPFTDQKLSGMRKTIARRLTESKQQVPHIYLTVDVRLDALLKLRGELNAALAARKVKLSVNDLLIKALGLALIQVPKCNVAFAGDVLRQYSRADIAVAVSIPNGLITPIVTDA
ncbi:MAG: 2-oxo acid dehydrogenase subunit E2, partial [Novosphingobium sp.]